MGFKAVNVFLLFALATLIQTAFAKPKPRDSTAVHDEGVEAVNDDSLASNKEEITTKSESYTTEVKIPGRISCEYEDATEDTVCQEHCLPKGYTYGICVSHTCSCI